VRRPGFPAPSRPRGNPRAEGADRRKGLQNLLLLTIQCYWPSHCGNSYALRRTTDAE
jgi:hypothetical protein